MDAFEMQHLQQDADTAQTASRKTKRCSPDSLLIEEAKRICGGILEFGEQRRLRSRLLPAVSSAIATSPQASNRQSRVRRNDAPQGVNSTSSDSAPTEAAATSDQPPSHPRSQALESEPASATSSQSSSQTSAVDSDSASQSTADTNTRAGFNNGDNASQESEDAQTTELTDSQENANESNSEEDVNESADSNRSSTTMSDQGSVDDDDDDNDTMSTSNDY